MTQNETTLEELKQRSHDYAFWFVNTFVGAFAYLFVIGGMISFISGVMVMNRMNMLMGCVLGVGGFVLIALLAIATMLKGIRINTRESLALQRSILQSGTDVDDSDA